MSGDAGRAGTPFLCTPRAPLPQLLLVWLATTDRTICRLLVTMTTSSTSATCCAPPPAPAPGPLAQTLPLTHTPAQGRPFTPPHLHIRVRHVGVLLQEHLRHAHSQVAAAATLAGPSPHVLLHQLRHGPWPRVQQQPGGAGGQRARGRGDTCIRDTDEGQG